MPWYLAAQRANSRTISIVWKVSKYVDFSNPYFPLFGLNTGKYGPEKTPYLDNFHAVWHLIKLGHLTLGSH